MICADDMDPNRAARLYALHNPALLWSRMTRPDPDIGSRDRRAFRGLVVGSIAALVAMLGPSAHADPLLSALSLIEDEDALDARSRAAIDDPSFGPLLVIEDIVVEGNESTSRRLILRMLPIAKGDVLRAGDPRFQKARFKLLATGYFRSARLEPKRGSKRGHVILHVIVKERGTVVLNSLYFGNSLSSPFWVGLDLTERNFFGTGLGLGGGVIYGADSDIAGTDSQLAFELRLEDPSIRGTRLGAHSAFIYTRAREPFRVTGDPDTSIAEDFALFNYSRIGGRFGLGIDITPLSRLTLDARVEWVDNDAPLAPTRELTDGTLAPIDVGLRPGDSRVITLSTGFDRDTRTDPVLPFDGDRLVVLGEIGTTWMGGHYNYAVGLARYEHWWPVKGKQHVMSVHLIGGLVLGEAPRFDRLHASDFNRLLTPRAFGLVMSTDASPDFLGTGTNDVSYGDVGFSAVVEYSFQLFRERFKVYGGDLFIGAGVWGMASSRDLTVRDQAWHRALPIGLVVDAGLRIDTEIGIFELTFANALGRIPL